MAFLGSIILFKGFQCLVSRDLLDRERFNACPAHIRYGHVPRIMKVKTINFPSVTRYNQGRVEGIERMILCRKDRGFSLKANFIEILRHQNRRPFGTYQTMIEVDAGT